MSFGALSEAERCISCGKINISPTSSSTTLHNPGHLFLSFARGGKEREGGASAGIPFPSCLPPPHHSHLVVYSEAAAAAAAMAAHPVLPNGARRREITCCLLLLLTQVEFGLVNPHCWAGAPSLPSFSPPPLCSLPFRALESICQKLGGGRRRGGRRGRREKKRCRRRSGERRKGKSPPPLGRPIICHAISLFCAHERGRKRANNRGL